VMETLADNAPSAESMLAASEEEAAVRHAVATLTPQQRAAVTLCYFEHYTNPEAAKIMGLNVKALEGLLVRARRTLRELLPKGMKGDRYAA
jgi:RNA polymerase sigma-70 factor (ECF subfamily)